VGFARVREWHCSLPGRLRTAALALLVGVAAIVPISVVGGGVAAAEPVNLTQNPGFEVVSGGVPACWDTIYGSGVNTYTTSVVAGAHTGTTAMRMAMTAYTSGDQAVRAKETAACASQVTPGKTYGLSFWYQATSGAASVTLFRHTAAGWQYWQDLGPLATTATYAQFTATTPAVPAGTDLISWGPYLHGVGTLTVDDFSTVDTAAVVPTTTPAPTTTVPPTTTPATTTTAPPGGPPNLVPNPGFETAGAGGLPTCWSVYGSGANTYTAAVTTPGRTGANAMQISMTARTTGDQSVRQSESPACAPAVTVGHTYNLAFWYTSTAAPAAATLFRHDTVAGWVYWADLGALPVAPTYQQFTAVTPAVPANTDLVSWGAYVYGVNTLTMDDYTMTDTVAPPPTTTTVPATTTTPAPQPNLVQNPSVEALGADGFPTCFAPGGSGVNTFTIGATQPGHTGANALTVDITAYTSGDRTVKMAESPACAPAVVEGHQYALSMYYKSTTPNAAVTLYRHDAATGWQYWQDLGTLPTSATDWSQLTALTPVIPAGTDMITWGGYVYGVGSLTTDDYSTTDTATTPPPVECTGTAVQCTKGEWQVLPFNEPVRGIHSVLLHNGKILLVAGSGNDPERFRAGEFKSAVFNPADGSFVDVPTPADFFCVGHAQLPDGKVLVMGGTLDYQAPDGSHGFLGLDHGYVFDPDINQYVRVNDLNGGHWYPSATSLGNGDVVSVGGLAESGLNIESNVTEYFSVAQNRWLSAAEITNTNRRWGLYPTLILMQDGRLFYTGSHSLGGNAFGATGAEIWDYAAGTRTDIPGLQNKDLMDHSMSLLMHPAQDQRVITMGGGNTVSNVDAGRLTNIIDLKQPDPAYTPGPLLPQGTMADTGQPEAPGQGKMYVNMVLLPDGTIFETGGSLHTRADDVLESSIYDPVANKFTPMTPDPIGRNYHASAMLMPNGKVMLFTSDPNNGNFEYRISVFSPPYLFHGPRPQITALPNDQWAYGTTQQMTVDRPIASAQLIKPAAVTHQSDPNQRSVDLPLTGTGTQLGVNLTANPNLAPPGWYMLSVTDANGVPSLAKWVKVG